SGRPRPREGTGMSRERGPAASEARSVVRFGPASGGALSFRPFSLGEQRKGARVRGGTRPLEHNERKSRYFREDFWDEDLEIVFFLEEGGRDVALDDPTLLITQSISISANVPRS